MSIFLSQLLTPAPFFLGRQFLERLLDKVNGFYGVWEGFIVKFISNQVSEVLWLYFRFFPSRPSAGKSFQADSIKLIALQMGPISPWIWESSYFSFNLISDRLSFQDFFLKCHCEAIVWRSCFDLDHIVRLVPWVPCRAVKDGCSRIVPSSFVILPPPHTPLTVSQDLGWFMHLQS